ncbi:DUF6851 domain-containing protein [uncultured Roseibium sp.]|uniref:DUF6851 domain-containing protein n=1 Tax=uncultured Roseibium sp. TaxID=1936171 RepID=UPI0026333430|nr:hypothetical protein [uncultured Roseibium sp.]
MKNGFLSAGKTFILVVALFVSMKAPAQGSDLANGNAATDIVLPAAATAIFEEISPNASDPSLVLRATVLITGGWYEAAAPFHPTAVGVYSRLGRQPDQNSADNSPINTAILYASRGVLTYLFPTRSETWDDMLRNVGLDPELRTEDTTTPAGIGNAAARAVVEGRQNDGINADGTAGGRSFNPMPFADYTGYQPVNTAHQLVDPSRWQPDIQRKGAGIYRVQNFVTPQYRLVEPFSFEDAQAFSFPPPVASDVTKIDLYTTQAQEVLDASAALDDQMKLMAEFFDNKISSLGFSTVFSAKAANLSVFDYVASDFFSNVAAFDAGIVVWQEKHKYDAVRPFSAIRHVFAGETVTAFGGPGRGIVVDLPAEEWASYLEEADHPEYPSATACVCAAHAEFKRLFFQSDDINWSVPVAAGSSRIEPGLVPAKDMKLNFPTWTAFEQDCGQSRVWAGVHFQAAVDESLKICPVFGKQAYTFMEGLLAGTTPVRPPSTGR